MAIFRNLPNRGSVLELRRDFFSLTIFIQNSVFFPFFDSLVLDEFSSKMGLKLEELIHGNFSPLTVFFETYTTCSSPIMHPICSPPSPKILHNLCFLFLLGITAVPREIESNAYAKYWGEGEGLSLIHI